MSDTPDRVLTLAEPLTPDVDWQATTTNVPLPSTTVHPEKCSTSPLVCDQVQPLRHTCTSVMSADSTQDRTQPGTVSKGVESAAEVESEMWPSRRGYFSRTDVTGSSSCSDSDSSSEDERLFANFTAKLESSQKALQYRNKAMHDDSGDSENVFVSPVSSGSLVSVPKTLGGMVAPAAGTVPQEQRENHQKARGLSMASQRQRCLLRVMRYYMCENEKRAAQRGSLWAEILPYCVSGYLDLRSILVLRQTCRRLYYKRRYAVAAVTFDAWCTLTEQELIGTVFPQLRTFLTTGSMSQLNFSRCCLLTDTFPKSLLSFQEHRLGRNLRALIFDYCYVLSDKSLETLLRTPLPHLEILSLRCARSRDLTGAPFGTHLSKERWPRFHQLSCSCTQITLQHVDVVARFLAERAVELSAPPKLGISGSLASNSLIRRLGLKSYHINFVNAIVSNGTGDAVEEAITEFETLWLKKIDEPENKTKVLHRLVRNRGATILVNAPCSIAIVDDGEGHEKAKWLLLGRRGSGALSGTGVVPVTPGPRSLALKEFSGKQLTCPLTPQCATSTTTATGSGSTMVSGSTLLVPKVSDTPPSSTLGCDCCWQGRLAMTENACTILEQRPSPKDDVVLRPSAEQTCSASASTMENAVTPSTGTAAHTTPTNTTGTAQSSGQLPCCEDALHSRDATYSRWTYPLPIAVRLANVAVVKLLLRRGAYCDVWGYNFATPLYIACATCQPSWRLAGGHHALHESAPQRLVVTGGDTPPLLKLGSIDSSSIFSAPRGLLTADSSAYPADDRSTIRTEGSDAESPMSSGIASGHERVASGDEAPSRATCDASRCTSVRGSPKRGAAQTTSPDPPPTQTMGPWETVCLAGWGDLSCDLALGSFTETGHGCLPHDFRRQDSGGVGDCPCRCHTRPPPSCSSTGIHAALRVAGDPSNTVVDLLLNAGAPVDSPDLYSVKCPVNAAIKNDNVELLEKLIAAGARLNVRALPPNVIPPVIQLSRRQQQKKQPQRGLTRLGYKSPLFVACELNAWRCVEALLRHGADPHWRDPFSNRNVTPALLAYRKNPETLQLFVAHGTGAVKENRWVLTEILAAAILQDDLAAIGFLATKYPDLLDRESTGMWSLPLIQAARLGKVPVVQTLLSYGANPNATNAEMLSALHLAANEGHNAVIECLLANGALPNVTGGVHGKTPLHIAVEENRMDVVRTLLKYGADITLKDANGHTPLIAAIAARNDKVALVLLQHASPKELDTPDTTNRTPLMYAVYFGQFKVADGLVEKGVTCRVRDATGATAESILKQKIQSLGGSTSTINKFFRNIVGAAAVSQPQATAMRNKDVEATAGPASDKVQAANVSDESVRKLNAKRKKIAQHLLKKIRIRAKKDPVVPASSSPSSPVQSTAKSVSGGLVKGVVLSAQAKDLPQARQTSADCSTKTTSFPVTSEDFKGEAGSAPGVARHHHPPVVTVPDPAVTSSLNGPVCGTTVETLNERVIPGDSPIARIITTDVVVPPERLGPEPLESCWGASSDVDDMLSLSSQSSSESSLGSDH